jgi:ABC-type multidrug transport system fused ATPase/permease subunit
MDNIMKRRYQFLTDYKLDFLVSMILGVLISFLEVFSITLIVPLLGDSGGDNSFLYYIDKYLESYSSREKIVIVALLIVFFTLLKSLFIYVKSLIAAKLRTTVTASFQKKCFEQIINMPIADFKEYKRGNLQVLTTIHTNNIGIIAGKILSSLHYPFIILFTAFFLFKISLSLTIISLFSTGLLFLGMKYVNVVADRRARLVSPSHKKLGVSLLEYLDGKRTIYIFDIRKYVNKLFNLKVEDYRKKVVDMEKLRGMVMPLGGFATSLSIAVILIGSLYFGDVKDSTLLLFLIAFSRLSPPVNALVQLRSSLAGDLPYLDEVQDFLDNEYHQNDDNKKNKLLLNSSIKLEGVTFKYPDSNEYVFNNFNLEIKKGEKVTIVGGSGSGKSTLVNILLGIEKLQEGIVLVDGVELAEDNFFDWRRNIGVVSQDVFLFDDTILGNITLSEHKKTSQKVLNASKSASLSEFINTSPNGFLHLVGENGEELSGGQKQRISIARALYRDPEVLVFDEATSALDMRTEGEIQRTIDRLSKESSKTLIFVTHRLSSIAENDRVIVLENGRIVEDGRRKDIEANKESFYNLLNQE